jgi:hypothetical protein
LLNILSRPETLNASGSRRACRMAISRNARSLPDFTEFVKQLGMVSPELRKYVLPSSEAVPENRLRILRIVVILPPGRH